MTAALIIAAGRTAHAPRLEPERETGTIPAIQRIAMTFQQAGIRRIVVVCGDEGEKTQRLLPHMPLVFLHSPSTGEMLESVKTGLRYLRDKCDTVLIAHTDVPFFSIDTVRTLAAAEGGVCVPTYRGRGGHPMALRAEYFPAILSYQGDHGLAGAVRALDVSRQEIPVADEGVVANLRQDGDHQRLVDQHDLAVLRPAFQFQLMREQVFFGPGTYQLLQLTEETGSLLEACRHMGISYSKGRGVIAQVERQMGYPILERRRGGKSGGTSVVTAEGRQLMERYQAFCREAETSLGALFQKYFSS